MRTIRVGRKIFKLVATEIGENREQTKIPTTFVPLSPERIPLAVGSADMLCGLFHIMWSDMPRPKTYSVKLSDLVSSSGDYVGTRLECTYPKKMNLAFWKPQE